MKNSRVKSFIEFPNLYKNACFTTESVESFYYDDASIQSPTNSIRHLSIRKFDSLSELGTYCCENENYSLTSGQVDEFQAHVSEELKNVNKNNKNGMNVDQNRHSKSLLSLIKALRNFSVNLKTKSDSEKRKNNTIYRQLKRPTEYVYVKGMSGLSNRIEKIPTSAKCIMRNG